MAVQKTMNATVTTGEYQNSQGETKKSYMTIGTLFIYDDGGMSLKLDALPLGNGNINFYEKKPKDAQQQGQPQQSYQAPQQQGYQPQQQPHTAYKQPQVQTPIAQDDDGYLPF
jgi:hypothetical protein